MRDPIRCERRHVQQHVLELGDVRRGRGVRDGRRQQDLRPELRLILAVRRRLRLSRRRMSSELLDASRRVHVFPNLQLELRPLRRHPELRGQLLLNELHLLHRLAVLHRQHQLLEVLLALPGVLRLRVRLDQRLRERPHLPERLLRNTGLLGKLLLRVDAVLFVEPVLRRFVDELTHLPQHARLLGRVMRLDHRLPVRPHVPERVLRDAGVWLDDLFLALELLHDGTELRRVFGQRDKVLYGDQGLVRRRLHHGSGLQCELSSLLRHYVALDEVLHEYSRATQLRLRRDR
jgi:hypothetical protein